LRDLVECRKGEKKCCEKEKEWKGRFGGRSICLRLEVKKRKFGIKKGKRKVKILGKEGKIFKGRLDLE
jgi:hypothetical protein